MAHIELKKPRTKRVKPPAPEPPPKFPRPRRGVLRSYYKEMFTTDVDQRVNSLAKAMAWYDKAVGYLAYKAGGKQKLTTRQLKEENLMLVERGAGIKAAHSHHKERFFIDAIKHYEKMCATLSPPKIIKYLRAFDKKRSVLEKRKTRLNGKFGNLLDLLHRAVSPKNSQGKSIRLQVDKINSQWRIDSQGNITFDRKFLLHLRRLLRKYGLFTPVLQCIPAFTESAASIPEVDNEGHKTGRIVTSSRRRYLSSVEMMFNLNRFMMTDEAPKRLVRKPRSHRKEKANAGK